MKNIARIVFSFLLVALMASCSKKNDNEIVDKQFDSFKIAFNVKAGEEIVSADYIISLDTKEYKKGSFEAGMNEIEFKSDFKTFSISVKKEGYKDFYKEMTFDALKALPKRSFDIELVALVKPFEVFSFAFLVKDNVGAITADYLINIDGVEFKKATSEIKANSIEISSEFTKLEIFITKEGYEKFSKSMSFDEIKSFKDKQLDFTLTKAKVPATIFDMHFGMGKDDAVACLLPCGDDYIVAGTYYAQEFEIREMHIIRIDNSGKVVFNKKIERDAMKISDGAKISDGFCFLLEGISKAAILFVDENGETTKTIEFTKDNDEKLSKLLVAADGSLYAVSYLDDWYAGCISYVRKFSASGSELWKTKLSSKSSAKVYSACICSDGDLMLVGYQNDADDAYDAFIAKLDASGKELFCKSYGTAGNKEYEILNDVICYNGTVYAVGSMSTKEGAQDNALFISINNDGTVANKTLLAYNDKASDLRGIAIDNEGHLILSGIVGTGVEKVNNALLLCVDISGNIIKEKIVGGDKNDYALKALQARDGNYVVAGNTKSASDYDEYDFWIFKTDLAN